MQLSAFDVPSEKSETLNIYHDESGTDIAHERFQLHGALMVPTRKFQAALEVLIMARQGYDGKIHFVDLRDKSSSPKASVAAKWLNIFFTDVSSYCFYKCMVVDMNSPAFDKKRFSKPHLLYNNTALLAVFSGITWSFKAYDNVHLSIFSEALTRSKDDNFEIYLPNELIKRSHNSKNCPDVVVPSMKVTLVNGDPRKVETALACHCEFIQLTDLITGSIRQALNANASQEIKIDLGKLIASWIGDTRLPPWLQKNHLHRRFSVSCYPSSTGEFYDVRHAIMTKDQLRFEGF
jgi:hypothetical protein